MGRKTVAPRTAMQDTRVVSRVQESFNKGSIKDVEPIDIPNNSVALLKNCRGHNNAIKGATGSRLWLTGLTLPKEAENLTVTLTGDVLNVGATIVDPKCTGYIVYATDPDDGSTARFIIKSVNGDVYTDEAIVDYPSKYAGSVGKVFVDGYVAGKINARYHDKETNIEYMLCGCRLHYRNIKETTWKRFLVLDEDDIVNAESQFFKIQNYIVLYNLGGIFRLSNVYDDQVVAHKMNGDMPDLPIDRQEDGKSSNPSVYRYQYGYVAQSGKYTNDRNNQDTFTVLETPPYLLKGVLEADTTKSFIPYKKDVDYTQYKINRPIDDTYYYKYDILDLNYLTFEAWKELTEDNQDPYMYIMYKGETIKVYLDFSTVGSMADVAKQFQYALRNDVDASFNVRYDFANQETHWFEIYNTDASVDWEPLSEATGFNASYYETKVGVEGDFNRYLLGSDDPAFVGTTVTNDNKQYTIEEVVAPLTYRVSGESEYLTPLSRITTLASSGEATEVFDSADWNTSGGTPVWGNSSLTIPSVCTVTYKNSIGIDGVFYFRLRYERESQGTVFRCFGLTVNIANSEPGVMVTEIRNDSVIVYADTFYTSEDRVVEIIGRHIGAEVLATVLLRGSGVNESFVLNLVDLVNNDLTISNGSGNSSFDVHAFAVGNTTLTGDVDNVAPRRFANEYPFGLDLSPNMISGVAMFMLSEADVFIYSGTGIEAVTSWTEITNAIRWSDKGIYGNVVESNGEDCSMGAVVQSLRYPTNRKDITHYAVSRTKDMYPYSVEPNIVNDPRTSNNPNRLAWVADVPCVQMFKCSVQTAEGVLRVTGDGDYDSRLIGCSVVSAQDPAIKLLITGTDTSLAYDNYTYSVLEGIVVDANHKFYVGTETVDRGSCDSSGEITTTYTFDEGDIGRVVFWEDKTIDHIKEVDAGGTAVLSSTTPRPEQWFMIKPTNRAFYDTVSDVVLGEYSREWGLNTRYYEPMPNTNIATYNNGVLMSARRDTNRIDYTGTEQFRSLGYHHSQYEHNMSIEGGLRCMLEVNGLMCQFTSSSTYQVNPSGINVIEDTDYGEYYINIGEPRLVHGAIGMTHQFKHKFGEKGDVFCLTSEPGARFFDGNKFGRNLADGSIQHTELQRMGPIMFPSYSSTGGITLWGIKDGR